MYQDYYGVLGVPRTATPDQIKTAYRKLAFQCHPDRNPGDSTAETRFKEVAAVFEVLSDPHKKSQYDSTGSVGRAGRRPQPPRNPPPKPPKTAEDFRRERETQTTPSADATELNRIECQFFGGDEKECKGKNILVNFIIPAGQVGRDHLVKIKKQVSCIDCRGFGVRAGVAKCSICHGSGIDEAATRESGVSQLCMDCVHQVVVGRPCLTCGGAGLHGWVIESVRVSVPPDHLSGRHIVVKGKGQASKGMGIAGNLHVAVILQ